MRVVEALAFLVGAVLAATLAWMARRLYMDYQVRVFRRQIALQEARDAV